MTKRPIGLITSSCKYPNNITGSYLERPCSIILHRRNRVWALPGSSYEDITVAMYSMLPNLITTSPVKKSANKIAHIDT